MTVYEDKIKECIQSCQSGVRFEDYSFWPITFSSLERTVLYKRMVGLLQWLHINVYALWIGDLPLQGVVELNKIDDEALLDYLLERFFE